MSNRNQNRDKVLGFLKELYNKNPCLDKAAAEDIDGIVNVLNVAIKDFPKSPKLADINSVCGQWEEFSGFSSGYTILPTIIETLDAAEGCEDVQIVFYAILRRLLIVRNL